jgi:hypothetical protein
MCIGKDSDHKGVAIGSIGSERNHQHGREPVHHQPTFWSVLILREKLVEGDEALACDGLLDLSDVSFSSRF